MAAEKVSQEYRIANFQTKQKQSYEFKLAYSRTRAWEFYDHPDVAGACYVAVGGLDTIERKRKSLPMTGKQLECL